MSNLDYTFIFNGIGSSPSFVKVIDHHKQIEHSVLVSLADRDTFKSVSPQANIWCASDGLTLAAIIYVCDWLARRKSDNPRRIHVIAPMWRPNIFNHPSVVDLLDRTLDYFTGDQWTFEWFERRGELRPEAQTHLDMLPSIEVALWSGGLDSGAGFLKRYLAGSAQNYVLIGSGANDSTFGIQRQVHAEASLLADSRTELLQVPINLAKAASLPKEPSQRSRGLVFLLVGSVCAYLRGQQNLYVYENGVGAINLPYCSSEIGLDHARSVHPNSLWEVSRFVSNLFQRDFEICNPFVFETKAQMCEPLIDLVRYEQHMGFIFKTSSCDSLHRQKHLPAQCGYCSSCWLRRGALAVNGIQDETRYAIFFRQTKKEDGHTLRLMLHQVGTIERCLSKSDPWLALSDHFPQLIEIMTPAIVAQAGSEESVRERIITLYDRYCREWRAIAPALSRNLVDQRALAA